MDIEGIKSAAHEWKTKYETSKTEADKELNKLRLNNAVERALMAAKTKNPKLAKAALDMSLIKLDGETILGLNEQLEKLKASDGTSSKKLAMKTKAAHPSELKVAEAISRGDRSIMTRCLMRIITKPSWSQKSKIY
ncbi:phage scaffolding protein [Dehalobacter restrictus]|uniref:Uncharacterized protein n=1 Tax=Dehalobacter restrictus TaxID=55583 RepID=A0A857DKS4_9FIRM|nr:phage scaffolding protein [Dehalobacter restrictus]QHA01970.1 hypothetical protein GQ588_14005 [Dehalobacter restrictus]